MRKPIDYSALLHCVLMGPNYINQFRFTLTFKDKINLLDLQQALWIVMERYPFIFSKLVEENNNYYLESLETISLQKDEGLFKHLNYKNVYEQAICFVYKDKELSFEAFHVVTDGYGALKMLRELVFVYDCLINKKEVSLSIFNKEEWIDAFKETKVNYPKVKQVYPKQLLRIKKKSYDIFTTSYLFQVDEVKQLSKKFHCTINEFYLLLFYRSLYSLEKKKVIVLASPINLRKRFPSNSLSNFSLSANLVFDSNWGLKEDIDIIMEIRKQMKQKGSMESLGYQIQRMQKAYQFPLIKYFPIKLKKLLVKIGHSFMGEKACMTISNLGYVEFPLEIEKIDVFLSPRYRSNMNCGIISLHEHLVVNISHDGQKEFFFAFEKELERLKLRYNKRDD